MSHLIISSPHWLSEGVTGWCLSNAVGQSLIPGVNDLVQNSVFTVMILIVSFTYCKPLLKLKDVGHLYVHVGFMFFKQYNGLKM